jgi:hypothetical protein
MSYVKHCARNYRRHAYQRGGLLQNARVIFRLR